MISYVLDASVAAKWFLPPARETLAAQAQQILLDYTDGKLQLVVPDLFWVEVGNVLWKAVRRGQISRRSAEEAVLALERSKIPTVPSRTLLSSAFVIAADFDRTVYDGLYIALAVAVNRLLLTADERLANAVAARLPVRWLGGL